MSHLDRQDQEYKHQYKHFKRVYDIQKNHLSVEIKPHIQVYIKLFKNPLSIQNFNKLDKQIP